MKKTHIAIMAMFPLSYLIGTLMVHPYGPDIMIHNKGSKNSFSTIRISGVSYGANIAPEKMLVLEDVIYEEGSIEMDIEGEITMLCGYCGSYDDGIIEIEVNGKEVKFVRNEVGLSIFNWDLR